MDLISNPMVLVSAVILFLAIGGGIYAVYVFLTPNRTSGDRLRDLTSSGAPAGFDAPRDEAVERIAERIGRLANPTDEEERNAQRLMLLQAGYGNRRAFEIFNGVRVMLAIGLPLLTSPIASQYSLMGMFAWVVMFAAAGYYVPLLLLKSQIQSRQLQLMRPFPDALDLLVSSVEAGLGLDAAFRRVAEELSTAAPELAKEFQQVNHEISAGVTRIDALKHLAQRTGLDEVNALVNMLAQAERFGTSIARSLRVHSSITRQKRMSRAEEEAAKVSPKLTIIMILFLLPCLMVVLLGPAAVNIRNALLK